LPNNPNQDIKRHGHHEATRNQPPCSKLSGYKMDVIISPQAAEN